jgi:hypothetical protein
MALAEALQELGLAHSAATVENEELRPAAVVELFEVIQFMASTEEHVN